MAESFSINRLSLCVLTTDAAAGKALVGTACGAGGVSETDLDGIPVHLNLQTFEFAREQELEAVLNQSDAAVLVVHHIDSISLELLKGAYRILPSLHRMPVALLVVRETGKMEFKMACPACRQKLWVRDEDQGRVGRCPHCKKTFVLPAQAVVIKQHLMLPPNLPVTMVIIGNPHACRGPLTTLAEQARTRSQVTKNTTVQVQVSPGQAQSG